MKEDRCSIRAFAKINLFLDVTGRRADGYHLVNMVMQSVGLCDELFFTVERTSDRGDGNGGGDTLTILPAAEEIPETPGAPASERASRIFADIASDERNLVLKAVRLLRDRYPERFPGDRSLAIRLVKRSPAEAGLGGGSADAAASLLAVDRLFSLGLSEGELADCALSLGADVPFCLFGGTMRSEGIGEILTPLPDFPDCAIVVAKPEGSASTGEIYGRLDGSTDVRHPSWEAFAAALDGEQGKRDPFSCVSEQMRHRTNILEQVTSPLVPEIGELVELLTREGATGAMMTGSGSAVFGLFADETAAEPAVRAIRASGLSIATFLTRPVNCGRMREERYF